MFCIILRGPAGSGKSTLAKELLKHYNAHYISIDKIKHDLHLKNSEPEKMQANLVAITEAREHLSKDQAVIIDEVFYYQSQLAQIQTEVGFPCYTFSLQVPLDVCISRNLERRKAGLRKISDEDIKIVYECVSKLDNGIKISSNRPINETLEEILSYLPTPEFVSSSQ